MRQIKQGILTKPNKSLPTHIFLRTFPACQGRLDVQLDDPSLDKNAR